MTVKYTPSAHDNQCVSVTVNGVEVGTVRKRIESYTGIKRGGRYTYFDFYPAATPRERTASNTTRKRSL